MHRLFAFASALVIAAAGFSPASAGEPVAKRLSSKADVRDLVDEVDRGNASAVVRAAGSLAAAGGAHAAWGLSRLTRARDPEARIAVLEAARKIDLRAPELLEEIREMLEYERADDVLRSACETFGRIGDGADVPWLLELAQAEERSVKLAAFKALRQLSGQKIGFVHARWAYWWRTARERAEREVFAALDAIEDPEADAGLVRIHERMLQRNGWILLEDVRSALGGWLASDSPLTRPVALRLVGELRLGDQAEEIRRLARWTMNDELQRIAIATLACLGEEPTPEPARSPAPAGSSSHSDG